MSSRATGNQREASVAEALDTLGYHVISLKGSGARGVKMRRRKHPVVGDLLAIRDTGGSWPWLQIEVGAHGPTGAFKALRAHPLPGFTPILIQYHYPLVAGPRNRKNHGRVQRLRSKTARKRVWIDEHTSFARMEEAVMALSQR